MPGFKIHHRTAANGVITVADHTRPYGAPLKCVSCMTTHTHKTYHFLLDENGDCVVSQSIMDNLNRIGALGPEVTQSQFVVDSEIDRPKSTAIGIGRGSARVLGKPFDPRPVMHLDFGETTKKRKR